MVRVLLLSRVPVRGDRLDGARGVARTLRPLGLLVEALPLPVVRAQIQLPNPPMGLRPHRLLRLFLSARQGLGIHVHILGLVRVLRRSLELRKVDGRHHSDLLRDGLGLNHLHLLLGWPLQEFNRLLRC